MKKTIKKYGAYGFIASLILFQVTFLLGRMFSFTVQEVIGYLTIVISLLFVFFAIKHFRDYENGGRLTLKHGLLIGFAITICVALGSAIADYIYVTFLYPDFVSDFAEYQLGKIEGTMPAEALIARRKEIIEEVNALGKPHVMALVMFVTVVCMGSIITILSSLFLNNSKLK